MKKVALLLAVFLTASILAPAQESVPPADFVSLFNGRDLSGWDGNPDLWSVKEGAITGQTSAENPLKRNSFLLWKGGQVRDFELRLKFRMQGGNTGIQYRSKDKGEWVVNGYQADYDMAKKYCGILYEEGGRGILAKVGEKVTIGPDGKLNLTGQTEDPDGIRKAIRDNEWNEYTIIARGNRLQHIINGHTTIDVLDEQADKRAMEGVLAFQVHVGPPMKIQFKDIYLKHFPQAPADPAATTAAAATAAKPDFSGDWKMDAAKSDFGPLPAPTLFVAKIDHKDPALVLHRTQEGGMGSYSGESRYTTDGKECLNRMFDNDLKSVLQWEGKVLVLDTRMDLQGNAIKLVDRWSLSADGKILTIDRKMESPQGEAVLKITLNKQ